MVLASCLSMSYWPKQVMCLNPKSMWLNPCHVAKPKSPKEATTDRYGYCEV